MRHPPRALRQVSPAGMTAVWSWPSSRPCFSTGLLSGRPAISPSAKWGSEAERSPGETVEVGLPPWGSPSPRSLSLDAPLLSPDAWCVSRCGDPTLG